MGGDPISFILLFVGTYSAMGALALAGKLYVRARDRLVRNPRPPQGPVTRIRGMARALTPIRSPIDQAQGVLAYTRIAARPRKLFAGKPRAEIATANDFAVDTPDGPFVVCASDFWVRDVGPASGVLDTARMPESVAEAIRAAGLDPNVELYYRERVVFAGEEVTVVGIVSDELPPPELRGTYREGVCVPTVSGAGGAVEVEPVRISISA